MFLSNISTSDDWILKDVFNRNQFTWYIFFTIEWFDSSAGKIHSFESFYMHNFHGIVMISANLSVSGCMLILCSASCCITEIKHYLCTVRNGMHAYVNECLILLLSQYYTFLFFSRSHICFLVRALYIQQKYASTQRPFPCSEIGFRASGFRSIFRVFSPMR